MRYLLIVAIMSIAVSTELFQCASCNADGPSELLDAVTVAIRQNYSQLPPFRVRIETVSEQQPAMNAQFAGTEKDTPKANRKIGFEFAPSTKAVTIYRAKGSEFRLESFEKPSFIIALSDGVFTEIRLDENLVWKRRPNEMSRTDPPWDIRNIGTVDDNRELIQMLVEDRLVAAEVKTESQGEKLIAIQLEDRKGTKRRLSFDPSKNLLPKTVTLLHADGSPNVVVEIAYQEALPGRAWILKEALYKIFPPGVANNANINGADWIAMTRVAVSEFQILAEADLPEGTFRPSLANPKVIYDNTKTNQLASDSPAHSRSSWRYLLLGFSIFLVVIVSTRYFRKTRPRA